MLKKLWLKIRPNINAKDELKKLQPSNFLGLLLAGIVNAFGVTMFIAPVSLYDSGISGTSILLSQISSEHMTLSLYLLILNLPLFLLGLKKQGLVFTIYSAFAVTVYSAGAWLITDVLPIDVSFASPLAGTDLLLCAVFGGMISGAGSGLAIRFGGAIDGIDVLAVLFAKALNLSVGSFVMIYNVILYIICGIVIDSWILPLYSIVTYIAALKTVDFIVEGIDRSKAAFIVTEKPKEICTALSAAFECGMTIIDGKGYYSDRPKSVVYIIVNRFQIARMRSIVKSCDRQAYVSISDVADVFHSGNL